MAALHSVSLRPNLPNHHSFNGPSATGGPIMGPEPASQIIYEGYSFAPREYAQTRGRWYQPQIRQMPGTQREFANLIRRQLLSDLTVMDQLYNPRMEGPKREHVERFINTRDSEDPGREHKLAYLKLERSYKPKSTRQSRGRTVSMQIILECKERFRKNSLPIMPQSASQRSSATQGPPFPMTHTSTGHQPGLQSTMLAKTPRPQYLPSYALQRDPSKSTGVADRNSLNNHRLAKPTQGPVSVNNDNDDSDDSGTNSPCSTASSENAKLYSRRTSSSAALTMGSPPKSGTMSDDDDDDLDSTPRATISSGKKEPNETRNPPRSVATGYFDQSIDGGDSIAPAVRSSRSSAGNSESVGQDHRANMRAQGQPGPSCNDDPRSGGSFRCRPEPWLSDSSEERSHDMRQRPQDQLESEPKTVSTFRIESQDEDAGGPDSYAKPAWMDNLQPVQTPTNVAGILDPLNRPVTEKTTSKEPVKCDEAKTEHQSEKFIKVLDEATIPEAILDRKPHSPPNGSNHNGEHLNRPLLSVDSNDKFPATSQQNASTITLDQRGRPNLHLVTQSPPQKHSENLSPKQRKRVTFDLPSPSSTNPNTPLEDSSSTSSSSDTIPSKSYKSTPLQRPLKPDSAANTSLTPSRRPPFHRSSHSTSTYRSTTRPHDSLPPRSSSYKDLALRSSAPITYRPYNNEKEVATPSSSSSSSSTTTPSRPRPYQEEEKEVLNPHSTMASSAKYRTQRNYRGDLRRRSTAGPPSSGRLAITAPSGTVDVISQALLLPPSPSPVGRPYECKLGNCPRKGCDGFWSKEDLGIHERDIHDVKRAFEAGYEREMVKTKGR